MTIDITTCFNSAVEWTERSLQILKDALICNIRCVIFDTSICQLMSCFNPKKYGYLHKLNAVFLHLYSGVEACPLLVELLDLDGVPDYLCYLVHYPWEKC